ncbi:ABC-three component system protein [Xanthomonas vasicola]|uniref:ABC-three component system protein n=1 Tax=Xanthomonas vasicola TaxID=56459 RepID=UPI0019672FA3
MGQFEVAVDNAEVETFQVLPEYRELEVESSSLTRQLNELANANTIDFSAIRDLENALASEVPPDHEDLQAVYQEAGLVLPDLVKRRYEDVKSFHDSVVRNRRDYLSSELEAAKMRIELRDSRKAQLDQRRGEILGILRSHGALEQFLKLQGELGRLEFEVESLRQRFEAAEQLEGTKNELEIERNRLTIRLRRDFTEQKDRLAEAIVAFEETSQRLYESAGSMTIDETSNGPVFKFPMQGQRSKGIKNMQIFCFDMMLMRLCISRKIGPGFLIHDSHLFDGVDGRQVISALRLGAEIAQELGFQYIVTMNEDDAFKETLDGFDLNGYVLPKRLTDATEDGGLFGIRFG